MRLPSFVCLSGFKKYEWKENNDEMKKMVMNNGLSFNE